MKYVLPTILVIDAIVTTVFGIVLRLFPVESIGTLFDMTGPEQAVKIFMTNSMATFYVLLGLVCVVGLKAERRTQILIGGIMAFRHAWIGTQGFVDRNAEWLIGSPWPDIHIHSGFVIVYLTGIVYWGRMLRATNGGSQGT